MIQPDQKSSERSGILSKCCRPGPELDAAFASLTMDHGRQRSCSILSTNFFVVKLLLLAPAGTTFDDRFGPFYLR